jgi:hypothetical protein
MFTRGFVALAVTLLAATPALAQVPPGMGAAMPDARQMSGTPLPTSEVPAGTVIVRVVRGSMANPLAGETVELVAGQDGPRTARTNDLGRAEFDGLAIGSRVKAVATVAGERLESQEFEVPSTSGIRVALVALDPEMEARAEEDRRLAAMPPQPGMVVLGEQSRFVLEMGDEGMHVFNVLEVVNTARTPVETPAPLVFELPRNAERAAMLEESSPQAQMRDGRVTVVGPFAPGVTPVQFAYSLPLRSSNVSIEQSLPVALNALTVMVQRVGDLHVTSPQFATHRDMSTGGETYILGEGPALRAGDTIRLDLTGVPHEPIWPTNLAIGLAVIILIAGVWGSTRRSGTDSALATRRKKLESKRDRLFNDLTSLETSYRERRVPAEQYTARRRELVARLEQVYAELDEEAAA